MLNRFILAFWKKNIKFKYRSFEVFSIKKPSILVSICRSSQ